MIATYFYDALNRRVRKVVGNETRTFYFNNAWQCVEERIGSAVNQSYVWGLRYVDDLVCRNKNSERLYALQDPNWNVVAIADSSAAVQERYNYSAFGKLNLFDAAFAVRAASACNVTRTFTGQVLDAETGLMLYRNRVYHPTLGRFVQRDPIGYEAGDVNLMRYVGNGSVNARDPFGLQDWGIILHPANIPPMPSYPYLPPQPVIAPPHQCSILPCIRRCEALPTSATTPHGKPVPGIAFDRIQERCKQGCYDLAKNFNDWYNKNKDITWTTNLPKCPCNLKDDYCKDDWGNLEPPHPPYHIGAEKCMRSKAVNGQANQCCYNKAGDLITKGSGQGSADSSAASWTLEGATYFPGHVTGDMRPADWATFLDGNGWGCYSEAYLNVRPQVKDKNCVGVPTK